MLEVRLSNVCSTKGWACGAASVSRGGRVAPAPFLCFRMSHFHRFQPLLLPACFPFLCSPLLQGVEFDWLYVAPTPCAAPLLRSPGRPTRDINPLQSHISNPHWLFLICSPPQGVEFDEEAAALEEQFGAPRGQPGQWAACLRIVDPATLSTAFVTGARGSYCLELGRWLCSGPCACQGWVERAGCLNAGPRQLCGTGDPISIG